MFILHLGPDPIYLLIICWLKDALSCWNASLMFSAKQSVTRALQQNYLNLSFILHPG